MRHNWILLTPELARQFLTNAQTVRPVNREVVRRYADDMRNNRWLRTHQGLAFDDGGSIMYDGRHRCEAVVESGVTIPIMVSLGVQRDALAVVDGGYTRTQSHNSRFFGLNVRVMPVTLLVWFRGSGGKPSVLRTHEMYQQHQEAVDFGIGSTRPGDKLYYHANIMAAVLARAWYSHDKGKIAQFPIDVVEGAGDTAAIFHQWFVGSSRPRTGGSAAITEIYGKTTAALHAYLSGGRIKQLRATTADVFPIKAA